jgi:hypothetical protein
MKRKSHIAEVAVPRWIPLSLDALFVFDFAVGSI